MAKTPQYISFGGIPYPISKWDKLEVFNPPKRLLVASDLSLEGHACDVYAYDPGNQKGPVITCEGIYQYCAALPWDFEKVCDYILKKVGKLVVVEGRKPVIAGTIPSDKRFLFYDGPGHSDTDCRENIIANGAAVYPKWHTDDSFITYDKVTTEMLDNLVKDIFDYRDNRVPRRATNRELSRWLALGNGEFTEGRECTSGGPYTKTSYYYDAAVSDNPVPDETRIRKWEDADWHEPTISYMFPEGLK